MYRDARPVVSVVLFVFARFSRRLVLTQGRLNYIQSEEIEVQPCFAVV